jgi:DNA-binding Lrp family transcriptional regulator
MPVKVYVLIATTVGKTREVCSALEKLKCIKSVNATTGHYDIIITIEGEDTNDILKIIASQAHTIPGIRRTVTCLAI